MRNRDRFGPWINTILHNLCLKKLTRHDREIPLKNNITDTRPNPQEQLEIEEARDQLLRALDELSPINREATILHYGFGFSIKEISQWSGVPTGTTKRRLHDARAELKKSLREAPTHFTIHLEEEIVMEISKKEIPESKIDNVNMKGSCISYVDMNESVFRNVDFSGGDFAFININGVRFKNTGGADGTPASDVSFDRCTMQKSRFTHVDLSESHFRQVNLSGVKLENCELDGLTINGIDIKPLLASAKSKKQN